MKSKLFSINARTKAICSLVVIFATLVLAIPAQAQLDPGLHDIFQTDGFGNQVKGGEIYVPWREAGTTNYVEHWVLFDNYVYPSSENRVVTTIRPSRLSYQSEEDFFARVAWGAGFRYVRVDSTDTDKLPGRSAEKDKSDRVKSDKDRTGKIYLPCSVEHSNDGIPVSPVRVILTMTNNSGAWLAEGEVIHFSAQGKTNATGQMNPFAVNRIFTLDVMVPPNGSVELWSTMLPIFYGPPFTCQAWYFK